VVTVLLGFPPNPDATFVSRVEDVSDEVEVISCSYLEDDSRRTTRASSSRLAPSSLTEEQRSAFARAEVMLAWDVPVDVHEVAPNLEWIQAIGAGVDHFRGARLDDIVVTNAVGVAAVPIAEFVIGRLLSVWKRFDDLADGQRRHAWEPIFGRTFEGSTLGVVGLGAIGTAVAERARAFGVRVLGVRRRHVPGAGSPFADEVFGTDELLDVLGRCDAVVLSAPSTPETNDLFDAEAFAAMRPGAVFCNVARGALVDEEALVDALESGHLGAAIVDVTKQEPLPADSRMWDAPRLLLSPHSSTSLDRYLDSIFALFTDNLRRYLRGEPLRNVVDLSAGY
jgi:phosphoglycerate dehydrogenase-like enzyme